MLPPYYTLDITPHFTKTVLRSCDLDEWTADQLGIMKVGGNGNAKLYLKKHGVPESQMTV